MAEYWERSKDETYVVRHKKDKRVNKVKGTTVKENQEEKEGREQKKVGFLNGLTCKAYLEALLRSSRNTRAEILEVITTESEDPVLGIILLPYPHFLYYYPHKT